LPSKHKTLSSNCSQKNKTKQKPNQGKVNLLLQLHTNVYVLCLLHVHSNTAGNNGDDDEDAIKSVKVGAIWPLSG
jgi:hypothetical protein